MDAVFVVLFLVVGVMVYHHFKRRKARSIDLPGPKGLPILHNLMTFAKPLPVNQLLEWKKQYGSVYKLQILGQDLLILADYDSVYEALVTRGRDCADRRHGYREELLLRNAGITRVPFGPKLLDARKFVHRQVRHYGKGVPKIEPIVREVADEMFEEFHQTDGQAFDPRESIEAAAQRVMYTVIVGDKPSQKGDRILEIFKHFNTEAPRLMALNAPGLLLESFPWLRYFGWRVYKQITAMTNSLDEAWMKITDKAMSYADNSGLAKAMLDAGDHHRQITLNDNDKQMACVNVFAAGVITTSTSFYILINVLLHHPEIQERILEEVNSRVPGDRRVSLMDRPGMPYTQAVLFELLRFAPAAPVAIPHKTRVDTQIQGHAIPKGTNFLAYLWGVHHDELFWADPWLFRPERFLDQEANLVPADHPNRRHLLTFGGGPRRCPGVTLAKARLFIWTVDLVRSFRVQPADPANLPPCDPRDFCIETVLKAPSFAAKFVPRIKKT